jgi:hypothetical protein
MARYAAAAGPAPQSTLPVPPAGPGFTLKFWFLNWVLRRFWHVCGSEFREMDQCVNAVGSWLKPWNERLLLMALKAFWAEYLLTDHRCECLNRWCRMKGGYGGWW